MHLDALLIRTFALIYSGKYQKESELLLIIVGYWFSTGSLRSYIVCVHRFREMLPGTTLDCRASDPVLKDKTRPMVARLGPRELELLREVAEKCGLTRSALARRLVVNALLELNAKCST